MTPARRHCGHTEGRSASGLSMLSPSMPRLLVASLIRRIKSGAVSVVTSVPEHCRNEDLNRLLRRGRVNFIAGARVWSKTSTKVPRARPPSPPFDVHPPRSNGHNVAPYRATVARSKTGQPISISNTCMSAHAYRDICFPCPPHKRADKRHLSFIIANLFTQQHVVSNLSIVHRAR